MTDWANLSSSYIVLTMKLEQTYSSNAVSTTQHLTLTGNCCWSVAKSACLRNSGSLFMGQYKTKQCTYNVIFRRVRETTVAVKKQ